MEKKQIAKFAESFFNMFRKEGITDPLFVLNQAICFFFLRKMECVNLSEKYTQTYLFKEEKNASVNWSNLIKLDSQNFAYYYYSNIVPLLDEQVIYTYKLTSFLQRSILAKLKSSLVWYNSFVLVDQLFVNCEKSSKSNILSSYMYGCIFDEFLQYYLLSIKQEEIVTPSHISRLMSELLMPDVDDNIYTPILGRGEHLISSYQKIVSDRILKNKLQYDLDGFVCGDISDSSLVAGQLNKLVLNGNQEKDEDMFLTIMNFYFHGIRLPQNFTSQNLLSKGFQTSPTEYSKIIVSVFPPITVKNQENIDEKLKLMVGNNRPAMILERCLEQLAEDGRLVALVPESFLSAHDKSVTYFRKSILEHYQLEAIVSLPKGVFANYSNIKTSIIVLAKHPVTSDSVWMCELKNDGYSLNAKRLKNAETPLPKLIENFKSRKVSNDSLMDAFLVPIETILNHRSAWVVQFYNDNETEEILSEDPKEILREIFKLEGMIDSELRDLSTLFGDGEIFG